MIDRLLASSTSLLSPSVMLELEQSLENAARVLEAEWEYGSCSACQGVVEKRGRLWLCKACGARYNSNPSAAAPSGSSEGHKSNIRRSTWNRHSGRRAGGPEKKDVRRQREFESELGIAALELMEVPPEAFFREGESGLGAATALAQMVALLNQAGGFNPVDAPLALALALKQVDAPGNTVSNKLNKPDISYIARSGNQDKMRVNIEIETQKPLQHLSQLSKDPNATNVFIKVHPWTGLIEGGWILKPNQKSSPTRLTPTELQNLQTILPKPVRDPSLTYDPKTGKQQRKPHSAPHTARGLLPAARSKVLRPSKRTKFVPKKSNRGKLGETSSEFSYAFQSVAEEIDRRSRW